MVNDKDLQYSARETAAQAAIEVVRKAYLAGEREGLDRIAADAYRTEYDAVIAAYRAVYRVHEARGNI